MIFYYCEHVIKIMHAYICILLTTSSSTDVTIATKLNCSNQSLLYKNVSEDEFVHAILENGTLDLSTETANKIEPGSYCIE